MLFLLFFRHLKITLDSEQLMLKEEQVIPSVWGGIKRFEHFQRGEYFSDNCAFELWVDFVSSAEGLPGGGVHVPLFPKKNWSFSLVPQK